MDVFIEISTPGTLFALQPATHLQEAMPIAKLPSQEAKLKATAPPPPTLPEAPTVCIPAPAKVPCKTYIILCKEHNFTMLRGYAIKIYVSVTFFSGRGYVRTKITFT